MVSRLLNKVLDRQADRIERASILDTAADPMATAADKALSARWLTNLLSGTAIGHPLHPLLVTLPIGAWSSSLVFDLMGQEDAAETLVGLGVLTAVPTAAAGLSDWRHTDGAERRVGLVHLVSNAVALTAYTASWFARRRGRHGKGVLLSLVGASAVSVGGWLGGHLSYAMGVGVDTTAFQQGEYDWTDLVDEAEVKAGELLSADLFGVPVLITRGDEDIVVLADRCTHRGAPLHEGTVRAGCVVCPWHGSEFALDGSVVEGPATRPQMSYEVKVVLGRVLARRTAEPRSLRTNPAGS